MKMLKGVKNKKRLLMGLKNAKADLTVTKFVLFHGPKYEDNLTFDLHDYKSLLSSSKFCSCKNTVLYLYGYLETLEVESVHVIVDAYLQREDTNLIVLDWAQLADGNYAFDAVPNIKQLTTVLAKIILEMFDFGLDINTFHIVGHSLGGQMAGLIGSDIRRRTNNNKQLKRISALDPAFPLFYMTPFTTHLSKNDAEFVDVIHTDAWIYGAPFSTGTADFWPNSGKTLQPGCPKRNYKMLTDNDLSSHRRSWWFWAESVANRFPDQFDAVKAKNWTDFKNGKYEYNEDAKILMGHDCLTHISGDFWLQTNGKTPFARGKAGTLYINPKELVGNDHESSK